jgi:hypothetical protein
MAATNSSNSAGISESAIELITADRGPHYEPFGWHHWPEHPWLAYQFRRGLGETQEGGGSVSEVMQAASRMIPGDLESWHAEWMRIADHNWARGLAEEALGHIRTAMNCFLRAADYYRQAEFHLEPDDPRRLPTFEKMEACSHKFIGYLNPPGEVVEIPYEPGKPICGYFIRAPFPGDKLPVLICMGGLDSIKDEMWFMQAHGCLQRGISVLMIDGPGQGGTLRRHKIVTRPDSEVPIGNASTGSNSVAMSIRSASPCAGRASAVTTPRVPPVMNRGWRLRFRMARSGQCTTCGAPKGTTSALPCTSAGCSEPNRWRKPMS